MLDMLSGFVEEDLKSEYIDPAHSSANLLVNLVNDILDLSQTRAGTFNLAFSQFNLYDHLRDIIQLMNIKALGKGLQLKLEYDSQVPKVMYSDPNRLRQIIINLIGKLTIFVDIFFYSLRKCIEIYISRINNSENRLFGCK